MTSKTCLASPLHALVLAITAIAIPATGSVAAPYCSERLEGGHASAPDRKAAEAAAISWWSSRAGALGKGFQDWDIAADKSIACEPTAKGDISCVAAARPCLPDGQLPDDKPKMGI